MTSPAELVLAEVRQKLDGQLATLESARTRAGLAITTSGVVAGLFAQHLTGPIGNWGLAALAAFGVGAIPAIWILVPHSMTQQAKATEWIDWAKKQDAYVRGQLGEASPKPDATLDLGGSELALTMAESVQGWYSKNVNLIDKVNLGVGFAFLAVLAQMVCWVGAIWR